MRIIIVEDEPPIAKDIERSCRKILGNRIQSIHTFHTLEHARTHLFHRPVDLCLLDLNLHGENGFDLLKTAVSGSFHTIIVSAYTKQAITAFEYGVLDFIPKPFDEVRMRKALNRYFGRTEKGDAAAKYLVSRKQRGHYLIAVEDISHFKADGYLVEAHLKSGGMDILDKSLNRLEQILPDFFVRVHRSIIVRWDEIDSFHHKGGGVYKIVLKSGENLPLSRRYYKQLKKRLSHRIE